MEKMIKVFLGWRSPTVLLIAVILLATALSGTTRAQSPANSKLVTTVTIPGWGGPGPAPCGTNPDYLQPVLRFEFVGTGPLNPLSSIPPCPATAVNDPRWAVFNSQGELFVANAHGHTGGPGSIARFTFDAAGNFIAHGVITGNSLEAVHGLTFSPSGELFAANNLNGTISRFLFDASGNAVPNGTIVTNTRNLELIFAANGELFLTTGVDTFVSRFLLDAAGNLIPHGAVSVSGAGGLHGLRFNNHGELFIADPYADSVFRFLFDGAGNPVPNGSIAVPGGPIGVTFSSAGELFVTSHFSGGISRFLFDASGHAIPNGFIGTTSLGGVAIFDAPVTGVMQVSIDIHPGSFPNSINPRNQGVIPVAILTTPTFDAATVDPLSVTFGPTGAVEAHGKSHIEDADGDGDLDLVLHFRTEKAGIQCGSTSASLTGKTFGGQQIKGSDSIKTTGCK